MTSDVSHRFKIGEIECIPVRDGTFTYPANWFFSNVPREKLEGELRARDLRPDQITSPYMCLLIKTGKNRVLVDTGAANFAPTTGELVQKLQAEGLTAADIDTVVLTHGHLDHVAGVVDSHGESAFPKARFVMLKAEWDFWTADPIDLSGLQVPEPVKALMIASARSCLPPIRRQVDLLEKDAEVVPGVHAVSAPGHTPGHMALVVASGREQLLYMADAVLHPMHLEHPDWQTLFDLAQDRAAQTRRELLDRAAADQSKVMAYHFPFPGWGHVTARGGAGWEWEAAADESAAGG